MFEVSPFSLRSKYVRVFFVCTVFSFPVTQATASIIHQVVNLDVSESMVSLDLNADGQNDFAFGHSVDFSAVGGLPVATSSLIAGNTQVVSGTTHTVPFRLPLDTDVCQFFPSDAIPNGTLAIESSNRGNWLNGVDGYLGVQFQDTSSNILHGWIQLAMNATTNDFQVVDFAYNSTGGACIATGQVPEPAGLGVLALVVFGCVARRRKS